MKKALVLGLGISGQSAAKHLKKKGYKVVGVDDQKKIELPGIETHLGKTIKDLKTFDLFVPSPGVSPTHRLYRLAQSIGLEISSEAELALRAMKQPCIGVTGTNGKTTVVKMIQHCLNKCGKKARALGNVGDPLTGYLDHPNPEEILVVELSSFQLETLSAKVFDVALVLNIAEDHLDRYKNFAQYAQIKSNMQNCLKNTGMLYLHRDVAKHFPALFSRPFQTFGGQWKKDNEQAAFLALKHFGVTQTEFFQALKTFSKPEHRLEFVAKINGISYYNDSKATNIAAVMSALDNVEGKVILIAGGKDKGLSFAPLRAFKEKISCLIAFGQCGEKIARTLSRWICVEMVSTVSDAVKKASINASYGESVLFSPGCTSFDAFENYAKRGDEFKHCVFSQRRNL